MHNDLDFNLVDDLIEFINNNTEFYKEVYYPLVQKLKNNYKYNLPLSKASFVPVVKRAYEVYKDVYDLTQLPEKIELNDLSDVCNKLYDQEVKNIEQENSPDKEQSPMTDSVSEEINSIAKLAGVHESSPYKVFDINESQNKASAKSEYMKENNIQPGTPEWFSLWFSLDDSRFPAGFRGRKK